MNAFALDKFSVRRHSVPTKLTAVLFKELTLEAFPIIMRINSGISTSSTQRVATVLPSRITVTRSAIRFKIPRFGGKCR